MLKAVITFLLTASLITAWEHSAQGDELLPHESDPRATSVRGARPWGVNIGLGSPKSYGLSLIYNPVPAWALVGHIGWPSSPDALISLSGRYYFSPDPVSLYLETGVVAGLRRVNPSYNARNLLFELFDGLALFGLEYRDPGGLLVNAALGAYTRYTLSYSDSQFPIIPAFELSIGFAY